MSYDLHQKLRTTSVRQIKRKDYAGAVTTLYDGAKSLLEQKEYGSGCDLGVMMLDAYSKGALESSPETRGEWQARVRQGGEVRQQAALRRTRLRSGRNMRRVRRQRRTQKARRRMAASCAVCVPPVCR
jgi:hypothetical protein